MKMIVKTIWICKECGKNLLVNMSIPHTHLKKIGTICNGELIESKWICLDSLKKEIANLKDLLQKEQFRALSYALDNVEDVLFGEATTREKGCPSKAEPTAEKTFVVAPKSDWQKGFEEGWVAGRAELIEDSKPALVASKKVKRMEEVEWERKN
jgi:hypothetical protein